MNKFSWIRRVVCPGAIVLSVMMQGCSNTGETVALAALGVAGAGWVGSTFATHSCIDVEVEVYNEAMQTTGDSCDFIQEHPLAVRELVVKEPLDPARELSLENFMKVVKACEPLIEDIKGHRREIELGLTFLDSPDRRATEKLKNVTSYLRSCLTALDGSSNAWKAFDEAVTKAAAHRDTVKPEDLVQVAGLLKNFRESLTMRGQGQLPQEVLDFVQGEFGQVLTPGAFSKRKKEADVKAKQEAEAKAKKDQPRNTPKPADPVVTQPPAPAADGAKPGAQDDEEAVYNQYDKRIKALTAQDKLQSDQVLLALSFAVIAVAESKRDETAKQAAYDELALVSTRLGKRVKGADLKSTYVAGPESGTIVAVRSKLNMTAGLNAPDEPTPVVDALAVARLQSELFSATFIKLPTDFNLGGIRNEVMQSLLTSRAAVDIVLPQNQRCWQKYSHAWSEGRAGNHDAVIYFEHLGMPILKSAGFDPTKFVVASGQMFRKAFSAMSAVYGVLPPNSASGLPGTNQFSAYNLKGALESRQAQVKAAGDTQNQLISSVNKIVDSGKDAVGEPDHAKAAATKALDDAIKALEKPKSSP